MFQLIKISKLKILKKYQNAVPPLSKEVYDNLKQSIREKGQQEPIRINPKCVVLDGFHRVQILQELKIDDALYEFKESKSDLDEYLYVLEVNVLRRQLDDKSKHKIYKKLKPVYVEIAKQKQRLSKGRGHKKVRANDLTLSAKTKEENTSTSMAASKVDLSPTKAKKMDFIEKHDPKLYDQIDTKARLSVNRVYVKVQKNLKTKDIMKSLDKKSNVLPKNAKLICDEFQNCKLKPGSVSLIFTDPPYHDKYLPLFEDLAVFASKVLRDGGSLVTYVGQKNIIKIGTIMENHGLKFQWPFTIVHNSASAFVAGRHVFVGCKIMLWFVKGKYDRDNVRDIVKSEFQGKELHEWAQSTTESDYYIEHMTVKNETVCDPFMGSGTFGKSAIALNRKFIGIEKDKNYFATAKKVLSKK